jgi:hypothetical protein
LEAWEKRRLRAKYLEKGYGVCKRAGAAGDGDESQ